MAGTSGPARPAFKTSSLYVGDLLPEVNEATLFELFNSIGPVSATRVCRDSNRDSRGYAFVNFHTPADAGRALEALNFTEIKGKPCRIMWCQPDKSLRTSGRGNIVVRGLHPSIDDKTLWDSFSVFGSILSCKVMRNKSGESRGYGYVHFEKESSAENAIHGVQGVLFNDKKVTAEKFVPRNHQSTAIVKRLPPTTTSESLKEAVTRSCGSPPFSVKVVRNYRTSEPAGYGYCNFLSAEPMKLLVERNDMFIDGQPVVVEKKLTFEEMAKRESPEYTNLYVRNLPLDIDADQMNELFVTRVQSKFDEQYQTANDRWNASGMITAEPTRREAKVVRSRVWTTAEMAYGCIEFETHAAAKLALELLSKEEYAPGQHLYVIPAKSRVFRRLQVRGSVKNAAANLYIKHLEPSVKSHHLRSLFEKFGTLGSCRVMEQEDGSSRQFGFVQFLNVEDADKAMAAMNGRKIPESTQPLYVAKAQKKADRRRQNRAQFPRSRRGPGGIGGPASAKFNPGLQRGHPRNAVQGQFGGPAYPYGAAHWGMPAPMYSAPPRGAPAPPTMNPAMMPNFARYPPVMPPMMGRAAFPAPSHFLPTASGVPPVSQIQHSGSMSRVAGSQGIQPTRSTSAFGAAPSRSQPHGSVPPYSAAMRESQPALTPDMLSGARPPERKRMIGERLFPKIQEVEPRLAGKITGMLLEMDNSELLGLLENQPALLKKINEALAVLKEHQMRQSQKNSGKNLSASNPGSTKNPRSSVGAASSARQQE